MFDGNGDLVSLFSLFCFLSKIAKVECDSTESRVVSLWKSKKSKEVGGRKRKPYPESDHHPDEKT